MHVYRRPKYWMCYTVQFANYTCSGSAEEEVYRVTFLYMGFRYDRTPAHASLVFFWLPVVSLSVFLAEGVRDTGVCVCAWLMCAHTFALAGTSRSQGTLPNRRTTT